MYIVITINFINFKHYKLIRNQTWQIKEGLIVLFNFTLLYTVNFQIILLKCKVLYVCNR